MLVGGQTVTAVIPMAHEAKPGKRQYGNRYVVCLDSDHNLLFVPIDLIRGVDTAIDARSMLRACWELHLYLAKAKQYREVGSACSACDVVTWSHTVKLPVFVIYWCVRAGCTIGLWCFSVSAVWQFHLYIDKA